MKEIGGYFELELPPSQTDFIHSSCIFTNSGRHALEYILRVLGNKVKKIYIPYYTCEVVFQPIKRLGLGYEFYHINPNLEVDGLYNLKEGEYIIINNYFGVKDKYITEMASKYGHKLIVDNSQAWYAKELSECSGFYSPRKFFGIPDGGVAWCYTHTKENFLEPDLSYERCAHLLKRIDTGPSSGYDDFRSNSQVLTSVSLRQMSKLSKRILSSIDFERAQLIRRTNYNILNNVLKYSNGLCLPTTESYECPLVYPYLTNDTELRDKLIHNKVFVATYWPNVIKWCNPNDLEYKLAKNIIPLPIDQRYNEQDMLRALNIITNPQ